MSFSGVEIRPLAFDSNSVHDQEECRLFTVLPAEIRDLIFAFTLAPFEDPDPAARFDVDTCFKRPNYSAPHKSDTALLRTCKRIYSEAWFRPWTASEQTFYFTHRYVLHGHFAEAPFIACWFPDIVVSAWLSEYFVVDVGEVVVIAMFLSTILTDNSAAASVGLMEVTRVCRLLVSFSLNTPLGWFSMSEE